MDEVSFGSGREGGRERERKGRRAMPAEFLEGNPGPPEEVQFLARADGQKKIYGKGKRERGEGQHFREGKGDTATPSGSLFTNSIHEIRPLRLAGVGRTAENPVLQCVVTVHCP